MKLINEWRDEQGLDAVPWGDKWWASGLLVPVDGEDDLSDAETGPLTEALEETLRSLFRRQRDDVLRRVRGGERVTAFDPGVWRPRFAETLTPRLTAVLSVALGHCARMGAPDREVSPQMIRDALEVVGTLSGLDLALGEGTVDEIVARVDAAFAERSARRIADATTAAAKSLAFLAAWYGTGVKKRWRTRGDSRVRPSHAHLEGNTKALDAVYRIGGCYGLGPGLSLGCPEEIFNCRCVLVAVQPKRNVDDDGDDAATLRDMRGTR